MKQESKETGLKIGVVGDLLWDQCQNQAPTAQGHPPKGCI